MMGDEVILITLSHGGQIMATVKEPIVCQHKYAPLNLPSILVEDVGTLKITMGRTETNENFMQLMIIPWVTGSVHFYHDKIVAIGEPNAPAYEEYVRQFRKIATPSMDDIVALQQGVPGPHGKL